MKEGSRCLRMTARLVALLSLAAMTKSSSRNCRILPRTTLANSVQPSIERITVMPK